MRHTSTPASRNRSRDRAARLGQFETVALKATQGAKLRISSIAPYVAATAVLIVGSLNWK